MDEPQEEEEGFRPERRPPGAGYTFSLAALLRTVTLVSMALGWGALLPRVRPDVLQWLVIGAGAVLGAIVGYRRAGPLWRRILAGGAFLVNAFFLSVYTHHSAGAIQNPDDWAWLPVVFAFPLAVMIAVFMLRAWTWSANDGLIHRCRVQD